MEAQEIGIRYSSRKKIRVNSSKTDALTFTKQQQKPIKTRN